VDDNQQATAADALNMGMSLMYGMTLGIPFNLTAPVKNVTSQMPHAQILTGRDTFEMGLVELANPETLKELHQYNVRPEFIMWESPHLGFKGKYTTAIRGLLSLYRASDMLNVYASASAGLVAWRRLESLIDGSGTLKEGISDTVVLDRLFRGETDSRVSEKEVMKHGDKKIFNGVVSKPIALEVLERLKSGKAEDAKRLWLQYNVNFSQWRYGPGGTPGYLRNALWRSILMFTSWAANDISFMSKTYGQGMEQWMSGHGGSLMWRSTQMLASQLAIMTILYQVGYKYAYNWIAVGPMPDELAGVGPLTGFINLFMKLVTGGAESLTARAIGVSSEDQKKADRKVGSAVDDLLDSFKSPWD